MLPTVELNRIAENLQNFSKTTPCRRAGALAQKAAGEVLLAAELLEEHYQPLQGQNTDVYHE